MIQKRLSSIKLKEEDLLTAYRTVKREGLNVRQAELQNVGVNINNSIELYSNLVTLSDHIMEHVDHIALAVYDARKKRKEYLQHFVTFILGVISSLLVTFGASLLF